MNDASLVWKALSTSKVTSCSVATEPCCSIAPSHFRSEMLSELEENPCDRSWISTSWHAVSWSSVSAAALVAVAASSARMRWCFCTAVTPANT